MLVYWRITSIIEAMVDLMTMLPRIDWGYHGTGDILTGRGGLFGIKRIDSWEDLQCDINIWYTQRIGHRAVLTSS
jgi:hypothetical protein